MEGKTIMRLYLTAKTNIPDVYVDFIEVRLRSGEEISLNWDESDISRSADGFEARYKGVYFGEEYANGRIRELEGLEITDVGLYFESAGSFHFQIEELLFEDGEKNLSIAVPAIPQECYGMCALNSVKKEYEVTCYLKAQGHPHPEEDGTLDEFLNGGELQWMYDEAVANHYDFCDVDRWFCLVNALGAEISFDASLAIEGALYEEDLDAHEFERAEDLLNTERGVCRDMLRASLGLGDSKAIPADIRLVKGEKDLEILRGIFENLLVRDLESVLLDANVRFTGAPKDTRETKDYLGLD